MRLRKAYSLLLLLAALINAQAQQKIIVDPGAIYSVQNANILQWGHWVYYYNCHREGGNDFKWYANNLPASVKASDINIKWVFKTGGILK